MKKYLLLSLVLILILTGCETTSVDIPIESDVIEAPNNEENVANENELLGTWKLQSQTMNTPAGIVVHPFSGRTLTFKEDGTYIEDYSTESVEDVISNTPTISVTSHCEVSGITTGSYTTEDVAILDTDPMTFVSKLYIISNKEKPTVTCETSTGGIPQISKIASTPLGIGPNTGDHVSYEYSLNDTQSALTITQTNEMTGVKLIYVFTK